MKKEFKVFASLLPDNTRVLDVGCGDGSLMDLLIKEKNIKVRGLEINKENVKKCISKGLFFICRSKNEFYISNFCFQLCNIF